jgi:hypothetical protein
MGEYGPDLESVTVAFDEETIEVLDEKAFADHRDNREAAIREYLDEWLKRRADGADGTESANGGGGADTEPPE